MEQKVVSKWKEKKLIEKVSTIFAGIISITIIILAIIYLTGRWRNAINVFVPLVGVLMLLNAFNIYKQNKTAALTNVGAALFIFVMAFLNFFGY